MRLIGSKATRVCSRKAGRSRTIEIAAAVLLTLAALVAAERVEAQSSVTAATAPGPATEPAKSLPSLLPGDVVRVKIWREPDLSGDFPVDNAGVVVLPKLGAVSVAQQSLDSLRRQLTTEYARYLRNPSVDVTLLRRINVFGSVKNPGLYPVDPTMSLRDVLALAGGVAPQGREDRVELRRGEAKTILKLGGKAATQTVALQSGDQLYVPQRSWTSRNAPLLAGTLTATAGLLISLLAR